MSFKEIHPKMFKKAILFQILVLSISFNCIGQFGFSHEIGAIVGPVAFQSDYGERYDFETNLENSGYGIGLIHYLNFSYRAECNCYTPETYFNDHFKLRTELSYNKTNLQHFGQWVEKNNERSEQLKAMRGSTAITNIGMQLEYFPLSIRDFTVTDGALAPFISLGAQYSNYNPKAWSTLGPLGTPLTTWPKYIDAFTNKGGNTWSIVSSLGSRYKLNDVSDLMLELRWQYYFSDWVDGLRPNPDVYSENKANDWNLILNFGFIYYIQ